MLKTFDPLPSERIKEKFLYFFEPYSPKANLSQFITYQPKVTQEYENPLHATLNWKQITDLICMP